MIPESKALRNIFRPRGNVATLPY